MTALGPTLALAVPLLLALHESASADVFRNRGRLRITMANTRPSCTVEKGLRSTYSRSKRQSTHLHL